MTNCLFSDELSSNANSADYVDRAALDAGADGSNSSFWTFCAELFLQLDPVDSFDGPLYANKNQVSHPTIDEHLETVDPNQQSMFSSSDLNSLKSMRKLTKKLKNQGTEVSKRKP